MYDKISKIFLYLFSDEMLVIIIICRTGIHKMPVRIADQRQSDPGLLCLGIFDWGLVFSI